MLVAEGAEAQTVAQVLDAESMKLVKEIEAQKCDARDRPLTPT